MNIQQLENKVIELKGHQLLKKIQDECGLTQLRQFFGANAITHQKKEIYSHMLKTVIIVLAEQQ